ncbi:MAG: hypothetical protein H7Y42_12700 [Chitinophagaceae bacterium]|nr:hypothetical protein [Chitinophagaceae bacterium]
MKRIFLISAISASFLWMACTNGDNRYVDLNTGETIKLEKDESGVMVNAETKRPVAIYVDTKSNDTIYGKSGKVINGHVVRRADRDWVYDADVRTDGDNDGEYKTHSGDYKVKVEKDGDIKIKDGDKKTKIDGETGEVKKKND